MPLFLINARDRADSSDLRRETRQAHLEWANESKHKITMAGPVLSEDGETMCGSTFVIEFENLDEAKAWAADDPYAKAGLFEHVEIIPFIWVIGDGVKHG